jgi:hypothetical protein
MRQWLKQAFDLNKIAKNAEPVAMKQAFTEIEGLNLFLKSQKVQPTAALEISPPQEHLGFAPQNARKNRPCGRQFLEKFDFGTQ